MDEGNSQKEKSYTGNKVKVLVVAPGSVYSTYDMYRYYMDALERNEQTKDSVSGFAYHNIILYHQLARESMQEQYNVNFGGELHDVIRASRELLIEVYVNKPDVILFIDGSKFPVALYNALTEFISDLNLDTIIACYLTEAPYINDPISTYDGAFDVVFTNDLYDYQKRAARKEEIVYYLPHSYSRDTHFPYGKEKTIDVFFCGTLFPERATLFDGVNWNGINAEITGSWILADKDIFNRLHQAGIATEKILRNEEVAEKYQQSKIVVNLGRTFGWDKNLNIRNVNEEQIYSMGPRVVEAVSCGAFVISEYRPEIQDIFGDAIPFFSSPGELEELIKYYLEHEDERVEKAQKALQCVEEMSYDHRLSKIVLPGLEYAMTQQ